MVSMKEVAAACHVSIATVSKALNDHHDIGESTKAAIRRTAKEMGYFPNAAARSLKTNRTFNIGVLFVDEANSGLTHEFFSAVLEGFKTQAEGQGYDLTFINSNVANGTVTYLDHCRSRCLDGVIIACVDFSRQEVIDLMNSEIPVVTIDHVDNNCTAILSDNVKGMEDLTGYICGMGHRKIAFIHGQSHLPVTKSRLSGFHRTLEKFGIEIPEEYIMEGTFLDSKLAAERTAELLSMKERPTCIIYPDDTSLIGGLNEIAKEGLKIPDDISVAGYDGSRVSQILRPALTTIRQDALRMGVLAADKLIEAIEQPKTYVVERILVKGQLMEGESVGKA